MTALRHRSEPSEAYSGEPPDDGLMLLIAGRQVRQAQAALADGDHSAAAACGQELLGQVEDLLERFASPYDRDDGIWRTALGLRDELDGYLLAATTLQETGVSTEVVLDVLRRGAAFAEDVLQRLAASIGAGQPA